MSTARFPMMGAGRSRVPVLARQQRVAFGGNRWRLTNGCPRPPSDDVNQADTIGSVTYAVRTPSSRWCR